MVSYNLRLSSLLFLSLLTLNAFTEAVRRSPKPKSAPDDEDAAARGPDLVQSSGDGSFRLPNVFLTIRPHTAARRSASSLLVDIAFERPYKWFMLPGRPVTPQLRSFHNEIIQNLKIEFNESPLTVEYKILTLRPGPLIPKKRTARSPKTQVPSVYATINITQYNTGHVDPDLLIHISQCGRQGVIGNLSISDQIIYPEYVCGSQQVFCLPECHNGTYCDGISDCPETNFDETPSCPKCLYMSVQMTANTEILYEDDELFLECTFDKKCDHLQPHIRWHFPKALKDYEETFKGMQRVNSLPQHLVVDGRYRCSVNGETSEKNITLMRKPTVYVTQGEPDADTVILTEVEGSAVNLWCNATSGFAAWLPSDIKDVEVTNHDERSSKLSFRDIKKHMSRTYHCEVQWGQQRSKVIKKTVKIVVLCNAKSQFECKTQSTGRSCIPIEQKCDSIKQCVDGSDELSCSYCSDRDLTVNTGQRVDRDVGDTAIMHCSASLASCRPLVWTAKGQSFAADGNIIHFKDSLFIIQMMANNSGIYRCSSASSKAFIEVTVHVNEGPRLRLLPKEREVNLTYGQPSALTCYAEYLQNVSYTRETPQWTKGDNSFLPKGVETISGAQGYSRILFTQADQSMAGVYYCQVGWGVWKRKVAREAIRVNIGPPICKPREKLCLDGTMCLSEYLWCDGAAQCPDGSDEKLCERCRNGFVTVQPSSVTVLVGQPIELHCFYDKSCYPVKWRVASSRRTLSADDGVLIDYNRLIVPKAQTTSSNVYECYSGEKRSSANVTVIQKVELKLSPNIVFVEYGENIRVDCRSNYGQPQWRRRDLIPLSEVSGARQAHLDSNTVKLSIDAPSYDSSGYYVCFVRLSESNDDAASSLLFVHVYDLKCPGDQLLCDKRRRCVPSSKRCDHIQDCLDGEDERNCSRCQVEVTPKELTLTTLGYGVIQCVTSGKDCSQIDWISNTGASLTSPQFYKFENSLYIFSPRLTDSGRIGCTSGQQTSSVSLTVKYLTLTLDPIPSDGSIIHMKKGKSGKVFCKSNIGTPQWTYPKQSSVFHSGIRYFQYDNIAVMYIPNVQKEANRNYICSVIFSREVKKVHVTVRVS